VDGQKAVPSRYNGVDVDGKAQEYYQRFYRVKWTPDAQ
jgi:iron complex transport system substrate-binding protein